MKHLLSILLPVALIGCSSGAKTNSQSTDVAITPAQFNADSAYVYIEKQVDFGPRVPGSEAHAQCLDYLAAELKRHGAETTIQEAEMTSYNGKPVPVRNIIGSFNPDARRRILLCAHWDSRPWADSDPNKANHRKPIDGADDGASGVGVLLEIARQLNKQTLNIGIDIVFFDAEDMGTPLFYTGRSTSDNYCLGSQYWSKRPHTPGYRASFGILLDMVGGADAVFRIDQDSKQFAPAIADKVWKMGAQLGYTSYFSKEKGGAVIDDHSYINRLAKIPCIDIINSDPQSANGFPPYWHTTDDTMNNISRATLEAVGRTVLTVLYNE